MIFHHSSSKLNTGSANKWLAIPGQLNIHYYIYDALIVGYPPVTITYKLQALQLVRHPTLNVTPILLDVRIY